MDFGERLKMLRKNAHLKQTQLARMIGIPIGTYNSYETKGAMPPVENLIKIARFLDTDMNTLLGFVDENTIKKRRHAEEKETLLHLLRSERFIINNLILELENDEDGENRGKY